MVLKAGSKAPSFTLPSDSGEKIKLSDFKGKKLDLKTQKLDLKMQKLDLPGIWSKKWMTRQDVRYQLNDPE